MHKLLLPTIIRDLFIALRILIEIFQLLTYKLLKIRIFFFLLKYVNVYVMCIYIYIIVLYVSEF